MTRRPARALRAMIRLAGAVLVAGLPAAASAITLRSCDAPQASAANLVMPPELGIRQFANGRISLYALDTGGEPACCSYHLMALLPDPEFPQAQLCTLISRDGSMGWAGLDLFTAKATYDAATGLTVWVEVETYHDDSSYREQLAVTFNQATGKVSVR